MRPGIGVALHATFPNAPQMVVPRDRTSAATHSSGGGRHMPVNRHQIHNACSSCRVERRAVSNRQLERSNQMKNRSRIVVGAAVVLTLAFPTIGRADDEKKAPLDAVVHFAQPQPQSAPAAVTNFLAPDD